MCSYAAQSSNRERERDGRTRIHDVQTQNDSETRADVRNESSRGPSLCSEAAVLSVYSTEIFEDLVELCDVESSAAISVVLGHDHCCLSGRRLHTKLFESGS